MTGNKITFLPDKPGVWTVTYTDSNGNTATKTITVAGAPEESTQSSPGSETLNYLPVTVSTNQDNTVLIVVALVVIFAAIFFVLRTRLVNKHS